MLRKFKDRPVRHNYGFFSSYIYLLSCKEMNLSRAYVFFSGSHNRVRERQVHREFIADNDYNGFNYGVCVCAYLCLTVIL